MASEFSFSEGSSESVMHEASSPKEPALELCSPDERDLLELRVELSPDEWLDFVEGMSVL